MNHTLCVVLYLASLWINSCKYSEHISASIDVFEYGLQVSEDCYDQNVKLEGFEFHYALDYILMFC